MDTMVRDLRGELVGLSTPDIRSSGEKFFKEEVKIHGVRAIDAKRLANRYAKQLKGCSKEYIFELCVQLWQSGYLEECIIACNWSYLVRKDYTADDFLLFESWIEKYITNWATCDTFCNHTVGDFLEMYPQFVVQLKRWAISDNRWMRRAAAVSLIIPARKRMFLDHVFDVAEILLLDSDDMVQKGYGWMLKSASNAHELRVFEWVMAHKSTMPRTALRYAIEKMPKDLRVQAMQKRE